MGAFHFANAKGRDAVVDARSVRRSLRVRWLARDGRAALPARLLRSTLANDTAALVRAAGSLEGVADALVQGDPDIDIEKFGRLLRDTTRVHLTPDGKVAHHVTQVEVLKNPDGTVRERRPRRASAANTNIDEPIRLSGRLFKKEEVYNKFVFAGKRQIIHVNGLTYDFLFAIAKELEEAQSLMLVGSGPRGTNPIIFSRGGTPYRGFLEGRTDGERYCLLLHLSNMELKRPPKPEGGA